MILIIIYIVSMLGLGGILYFSTEKIEEKKERDADRWMNDQRP